MTEEADYARHIIQKHRIAIAIAVIKNKPPHISLDDYLQELREKIQPSNPVDKDALSDSISSLDFNLDIDNDQSNIGNASGNEVNRGSPETDKPQENCTGNLDVERIYSSTNIENVIDPNVNHVTFEVNAQYYHSTEQISQNTDTNRSQFEFDYNDIQEAIDKTLSIHDDNSNEPQELNDSMDILEGFRGMTDNGDLKGHDRPESFAKDQDSQALTEVFTMIRNVDQGIEELRQNINSQMTHCDSQQALLLIQEELRQTHDDKMDSQETIFYTMNDHTQNYTHVSQSQAPNFVVEQHFIKNNTKNTATNAGLNNLPQIPNETLITTSQPLADNPKKTKSQATCDDIAQDVKILDYYDHDYTQTDHHILQEVQHSSNNLNMNEQHHSNFFENQLQPMNVNINFRLNSEVSSDNAIDNNEEQVFSDEDPAPSQDVVPFKIIEEMNKIKSALNKKARRISADGHSTDSGYRSDSQKSLRNSLHLTDNWLNQSGSSLLHYIVQSPLIATTQEINEEISQVLGNLIDRLHADEKYPTFLEDILENVDTLLKHLNTGENNKDLPMQKDDHIQRLILLNKSIHIQKYTLSKIASVLEHTYTKLTDKDVVYELENINEMENLAYIFHLLEIIICKYQKYKSASSQANSQSSQISDSIKRSSITDLWRKKWNFSKETVNVKENESICILSRCREILNKIIVGCMDGYSLFAYSALQCFNMLQN